MVFVTASYFINSFGESEPIELIIDADYFTELIILDALNNTDEEVVKYISLIKIVSKKEVSSICNNDSVGCKISTYYSGGGLDYTEIYLSPTSFYFQNYSCVTFNNTLYHEIGHVVYDYKFGDTENIPLQEQYAENYANQFSKGKCDTEEYNKLNNEFDYLKEKALEIDKQLEEKALVCDDIIRPWMNYYKEPVMFNPPTMWVVVGDYIPEGEYELYLQNYYKHEQCLEEYNSIINNSNLLTDDYNQKLTELQEYLGKYTG